MCAQERYLYSNLRNETKKCMYPNCSICVYKDCRYFDVLPEDVRRQDRFDSDLLPVEPEIRKKRKRQKRYENSSKAKERKKRYFQSEKGKEAQNRYLSSEKGKEMLARKYEMRKIRNIIRKEECFMRLGKFLSTLTKPELENLCGICNMSEDEQTVCRMLAVGKSVEQIREEMLTSRSTVTRRIMSAKRKVGCWMVTITVTQGGKPIDIETVELPKEVIEEIKRLLQ